MNPKLIASICITAALANVGLAQITNFDSLNGYASGADARIALGRSEMLHAARSESASNLIVAVDYFDRKVDASADNIEHSAHGEDGRVGYNWRMTDWSFGGAVGYGSSHADYNEINSPSPTPLKGYVDSDATEGYVWAAYSVSGWRFAVVGSIGTTKNKARRTSDAGTSFGNYDTSDHAVGLSLSHEYPASDSLIVEPFVGLSFASAAVDGFTEQGTAPDRRMVQGFSVKENRAAIGVRISGKDASWKPFAGIAWLARFSSEEADIYATTLNGSNLSVGQIQAASKGLLYASAGISGKMDENWSYSCGLEYYVGGKERSFRPTLSIGRKF